MRDAHQGLFALAKAKNEPNKNEAEEACCALLQSIAENKVRHNFVELSIPQERDLFDVDDV